MPRVLIVSHPSVIGVNQLPHARLRELGWDVFLAVPDRWFNDYSDGLFDHETLPELEGRVAGLKVVNPGLVQRHVYVRPPGDLLRRVQPDVVFIEEEPTSLAGAQWAWACHRAGIPFGMQIDENLDRPYHRVAKAIRGWTLPRMAFLASRSPAAAAIAQRWGYTGPAPLVPHPVPLWEVAPRDPGDRPFTIGFAGRLVPQKGLHDLLAAAQAMGGVTLRLVGNGELADELRAATIPGGTVELITDIGHADMPRAYAGFDVLVLPSRTTPTWAEQFGRVLVEAMWCGVPVVGSDSGEIPWVIRTTGGGLVFPEGDADALRAALERLRDDPALRDELAAAGRQQVAERFTIEAAARDLDAAMRAALAG